MSDRIAWQVERHFGRFGTIEAASGGVHFHTSYASARQLASWVLSLGEHANVVDPPELVEAVDERIALLASRHERQPDLAPVLTGAPAEVNGDGDHGAEPTAAGRREAAIRPERFARLVTLASILIDAGRRPAPPGGRRARAPAA